MPFQNPNHKQQAAFENFKKKGLEAYKNAPGFFTPYKNFSEFSDYAIGSAVALPILAALASAAAAAVAALAILPALGGLGVAGGAALIGAKETTYNAFSFAADCAVISLAATAFTIVAALAAVLTAILAPVAILTRLGATAYAAVVKTPAVAANNEELAGLVPGM